MGRKQKLPFEHWQIIELLHIAQDFYSKPENETAFQDVSRVEGGQRCEKSKKARRCWNTDEPTRVMVFDCPSPEV